MKAPVFVSPAFPVPAFDTAVRLAVEAGLDAAAILDGRGTLLALAGALDRDEARAIAAHATRQLTDDRLERLLDGALLDASMGDRAAQIGIASRCVFVVVVFPREPASTSLVAVRDLYADIGGMLRDAKSRNSQTLLPPPTGSGGSSSGPAQLPVIELGVTVRRRNPSN